MNLQHLTISLTIILLLFSNLYTYSQYSKQQKKIYTESVKLFNEEDYSTAIPGFLKIVDSDPTLFEIKYYLGVCYLNTGQIEKSLPFLEHAIKTKESSIPADIFKDMGRIYQNANDFAKALDYYKKFQRLIPITDPSALEIRAQIETIKNAKKFMKDSSDVKLENIGTLVNTPNSESRPFVNADESMLFYTSSHKMHQSNSDSLHRIMLSQRETGYWRLPNEIILEQINPSAMITIAGIYSDGQFLLLNIDNKLYTCRLQKYKCTDITLLPPEINNNGKQYAASISADGKELYFSSDMPGGIGGKDLYKSVMDESGKWSQPKNLGTRINSKFDEDYPFIYADNRTLYFSSNGWNTMGGYDIFKSIILEKGGSQKPKNLGYPINTTRDDYSFSMTANGKTAYISRNQDKFNDLHDIYRVVFKNTVPLTLVKGTIMAGEPYKPIGARIKVIDKESGTFIKYIYNPNPQTGKFLMIFPPGKNYDMLVEADNYLPQVINIYVPNQTYFYELYQEILLKPVKSLGKVVGEEIVVKNTFFDIMYNTSQHSDSVSTIMKKDYNTLIQLIGDIINSTDSLQDEEIKFLSNNIHSIAEEKNAKPKRNIDNLINLINTAINTNDSTALNMIEKNTIYQDKARQLYFYAENKMNNLVPYVVNNKDTIYTVPHLNTIPADKDHHTVVEISDTSHEGSKVIEIATIDTINLPNFVDPYEKSSKKIILSYTIEYNKDSFNINEKTGYELDEIFQLVKHNKGLHILVQCNSESPMDFVTSNTLAFKRTLLFVKLALHEGVEYKKLFISENINPKQKNTLQIKVFELLTDAKKLIPNEKIDVTTKESVKEKSIQSVAKNVIYKVQLKASLHQLSIHSELFKGVTVSKYYHNGMYKYVVGEFLSYNEAKTKLLEMIEIGFSDAFIVVFKGDKRIEMKEAVKFLKD
jgi:tetratricopeptide (TPR) repeat protein/outer membrane protein OmpA-like peptidoglycan-associated protein